MLTILTISRNHDWREFASGDTEADLFLANQFRNPSHTNGASTYVLVDSDNPHQILGFPTLFPCELELNGEVPIPSLKIGWVGVDRRYQRHGYGALLEKPSVSAGMIWLIVVQGMMTVTMLMLYILRQMGHGLGENDRDGGFRGIFTGYFLEPYAP